MIDKVVTLDNNISYYILDEYKGDNGNNYVFGVEVDKETSNVTNRYIFLKEMNEYNMVYYNNIEDNDEFNIVGSIFIDRMTN